MYFRVVRQKVTSNFIRVTDMIGNLVGYLRLNFRPYP